VVLQAGAMGLPQVVTNINGSNEIIIDKENGLIIPVKDTEALYRSMQELLTNNSLRSELATNARDLIVTRFQQQVVWEALLAEYMRLLKTGHFDTNSTPRVVQFTQCPT
ncbi:MAG TPA: glycosyltransferase, partial [Lutibacter sp.]|nr:glycosyltransferase [Lutibacter sp.]